MRASWPELVVAPLLLRPPTFFALVTVADQCLCEPSRLRIQLKLFTSNFVVSDNLPLATN